MVTNTIEIGTARRPLRRVTRAARTAVSPRTPRPATHRTRLPGQAPQVPAPAASLPVARAARPVAFALAVLAVLATVAPEQAAAQTETTFISNTGQTASSGSNLVRATAFTTGAGTYTLSSVAIHLVPQAGSPTPVVQIYGNTGTGGGSSPGTVVATMTNPGTIVADTVNIFTAPANTTLSASTTYWLVTSNSALTAGTGFWISPTTSQALDSGAAAGWTLGTARFKNNIADTSWTSSNFRHRFQIRGTDRTVPADWSLKPTGLTAGAKFRLLFLSSTKRDATATDIATYNTFVQNRAAAGHADIQAYSAVFRAVGCTADTDARDNTATTYTTADTGVRIYWLNGAKAADDYEDFYDGSWDEEASDKNESGTDGPDTSQESNYPFTGCSHEGTVEFNNTQSRALGNSLMFARVGRPNSSGFNQGPIDGSRTASITLTRPMYGLSEVFQVNTPTNNAPTAADGAVTTLEDTAYTFAAADFNFSDTDSGDALESVKITVLPSAGTLRVDGTAIVAGDLPKAVSKAVIDAAKLTYAPVANASGTATFNFKVNDGTDDSAPALMTITINAVNDAPTVATAIPDQTATVGTAFIYSVPDTTFNDVDTGQTLSYMATKADGMALPTWLVFTAGTRTFAGTPAASDVGTVSVKVTASDSNGGSVSDKFDITVANTAPGAPTTLTATASGTTTINLSWTAPASTGGSAITGYKIEVSSDGGSSFTDQVANTGNATTTYAHTGLAADTTRHYRVSAINSVGTSIPSDVASATTTTANTAPGAPTTLTATASGTTTINLSWTAPVDNGGSAITGYKIEISPDGITNWTDLTTTTASTTTHAHIGLAADTTRHYRVSAINSVGTSTPSDVASATTTTANTAPGAPTSLTATASGTSTINLSWTAPGSDGGSPITGYKIEVSSNGGSSWTELVANTGNANTTYAHSGLAADTTRHYRVSAINSIGTSTASNVANATTGASVPGAPTSLSATASGSTTINLSWSAPASTGGSAITGYKIEVSSDGGSSWSELVANTGNANTTYAHSGLADGATRHYRVSAINSIGTSTASNVDDATTGRTTVTFDASSYTAEESGAPATVTVELSAVPLSPVTIPLVVTHLGGATPGDYEGLPSSVTFWTTGRSRTFTVRAIDDSNVDGGESVQIGFGTLPAGYAAGTPRTATVALVDDETELIVDFGTGADSNPIYVRESDVNLHHFTVSLRTSRYSAPDGNRQQPVTIPLVVTHRGGATPDDYEGLPSSVTFEVGESVTGFTMRAIPDGKVEIGEGLRLDFGALPAGVRKGSLGPYETIEFVDEAASVPGAPTSLSATASGSTGIDLSWTAPASNGGSVITGYKIEVSSNGGSSWSVLVADTGNANTTYAHSGLTASTTRHYRVSAINSNGTGSPSNVDDATTTGTTVPGAPTSLSATASGSSTINLSWSAPSSTGGSAITGYKIEVSSDGGSSWSEMVADTGNANTTYAHTGLAAVATRHYRVSAINANGTGTHSNVANATTGRTTVTFNASSYTAEESGALATVTVELSAVPSSAVTIPLVVTHLGGATPGDYEGLPSSVRFWTTGRSRTFTVRAIDDSNMDGGESVQIGFGTLPAGYAAGTHRTATVALVDDETELIVNFGTAADATVKVREGPVPHRLTMVLDSAPQQPVTIPLVVTHVGGATAADYTDLPASVTFAAGKTVAGFDIRAIPDQASEIGEGLRLDFGALPAGVRKGAWGPYETIEFVDAAPAANLSVSGTVVTVGYPGALDGGSTPSPRDFVVSAEAAGGGKAMVAVTAVSVRGSDVLLDLDRPVAPDETVTLSYLADAMHPIRDAAGLPAPPLADEPVRNDTPASGPGPEAGLPVQAAIPAPMEALLEAAPDGAGSERLDLSSRNLTDVSALAGLIGLRELDLRDNAITDLSPLAGLTGLQLLDLRDNQIMDLSPLAGLTGLQLLYLSGNRIEELWPLAGLTALEQLNLSDNRIGDLSPLAGLSGLQVLDLAGNRIEELWPLAGLTALERLNLSDNRIEDLWPLAGLSGLQVLLLDRNRVADVSALSPLAELANLGLSGNRIADIGRLSELGRLRRLDLSGNAVADVSALGGVSGLVWLRLPGNPVSDVAPLGRLEKLRWLWLDWGTAAGMEALAPPAGHGAAQLWIERPPAH